MWRLLCAVSKLATGAELAVSCREKPALWGPGRALTCVGRAPTWLVRTRTGPVGVVQRLFRLAFVVSFASFVAFPL